MSLIGSHVGCLLLTTERLLFLSTGVSGLGKELALTAIGGPSLRLTLGETTTDQLELSALENEGSLRLPLDRITSARVSRRWDFSSYLVVEAAMRGRPRACSFMTRFGQSRGRLLAFLETLESARTAAVKPVARA